MLEVKKVRAGMMSIENTINGRLMDRILIGSKEEYNKIKVVAKELGW